MAEAKDGPDWQKITGCSIAAVVLICIFLALSTLSLVILAPIAMNLFDALT